VTRERWYFHTTCVNSDCESITDMQAKAETITYRTLRRHVGGAVLEEVERALSYDTGTERGGLRMSKDWHVSYAKSEYQGKPCLYFAHSHIEYIFLQRSKRT
jgi:hypothetical protein